MIGAKLGAGREADVHAWGDDAVVKLYRPGFGGHRAKALALGIEVEHPTLVAFLDRSRQTAAR